MQSKVYEHNEANQLKNFERQVLFAPLVTKCMQLYQLTIVKFMSTITITLQSKFRTSSSMWYIAPLMTSNTKCMQLNLLT